MQGVHYAVSSMQGWRVHMEDSHVHKLSLNLNPSQPPNASPLNDINIFAVYDGHGGDYIAKASAEITVDTFINSFKQNTNVKSEPNDLIKTLLIDTFLKMDEKMRDHPKIKNGEDNSGCTAVCGVLTIDSYIVANAGDSRCIIIGENGEVKFTSKDHKPDLPEETERISKAGGYVSMRRVNGDLAVSRGLGDYLYKRDQTIKAENQQVSPLPDVTIIPRSKSDLFMVVACDGIWDVMSNEECGKYLLDKIKSGKNLKQMAEDLLDYCLNLNSRDNMSVIIVGLPGIESVPKASAVQSFVGETMDVEDSKQKPKSSNLGSQPISIEATAASAPATTAPSSPRKGTAGNTSADAQKN